MLSLSLFLWVFYSFNFVHNYFLFFIGFTQHWKLCFWENFSCLLFKISFTLFMSEIEAGQSKPVALFWDELLMLCLTTFPGAKPDKETRWCRARVRWRAKRWIRKPFITHYKCEDPGQKNLRHFIKFRVELDWWLWQTGSSMCGCIAVCLVKWSAA